MLLVIPQVRVDSSSEGDVPIFVNNSILMKIVPLSPIRSVAERCKHEEFRVRKGAYSKMAVKGYRGLSTRELRVVKGTPPMISII